MSKSLAENQMTDDVTLTVTMTFRRPEGAIAQPQTVADALAEILADFEMEVEVTDDDATWASTQPDTDIDPEDFEESEVWTVSDVYVE